MATKSKKTAPVEKEAPVTQETAPQTEAAPAAVKARGPKGVSDNAVVKLLVTANPKREGSKAFDRFAAYKDEQTVAEALDAGVTTPDLVYDAKHGFISIEGYDPGEIVQPKPKAAPKPKAEKKGKKEKVEKTPEQKAAESAADAEAKEETLE